MQLKHGSYEVNPPFVPAILTAAAHHNVQLLQAAEAAGGALAFVVLMPGWQEVSGWQLLNSSSFKRQTLLLAAADHGGLSFFCCWRQHSICSPSSRCWKQLSTRVLGSSSVLVYGATLV